MLKQRLLVRRGLPVGVAAIIFGGYYLFGTQSSSLLGLHEYYTLLRPYRPNLLVGYLTAFVWSQVHSSRGSKGCWERLPPIGAYLLLVFAWRAGVHLVEVGWP